MSAAAAMRLTQLHGQPKATLVGPAHASDGTAGRKSSRLIVRAGTLRCSVNGLPLQDRSPQRFSRVYSLSKMGPRTFRTSRWPRAGLMVRRMKPSLVCRVETPHSAIAARQSPQHTATAAAACPDTSHTAQKAIRPTRNADDMAAATAEPDRGPGCRKQT